MTNTQAFVHEPHSSTNSEATFLQDYIVPENLEEMFLLYYMHSDMNKLKSAITQKCVNCCERINGFLSEVFNSTILLIAYNQDQTSQRKNNVGPWG